MTSFRRSDVMNLPTIKDPGEIGSQAENLANELKMSLTVADALYRKGHRSGDALNQFLNPKLAHLSGPEHMIDRDKSANRVAQAIRNKETICIFGDYDCDGITSTSILTGFIRELGGHVFPCLATRSDGSYGLSHPALTRVLQTNPSLVITCDCGSSDHERLEILQKKGIDSIVIDHHLVPEEKLPVFSFLNPHRPECGFLYKGLASCGLALSLTAAIRKELGSSVDIRSWLDLVAIGTIADVAPLTGDNRALVKFGFSSILNSPRPGIKALSNAGSFDISRRLHSEDISFKIAPRMNAPGRLSSPDIVLDLLLEKNLERANELARAIEEISKQRRILQDEMLDQALKEIKENQFDKFPGIVLARQGWHPGIVGILAGRIATLFNKPTIVISIDGLKGRGSVRGPKQSKLYDALSNCKNAISGFGGHQAAAGVEVLSTQVDKLRNLWCSHWDTIPIKESEWLTPDVRLDPRDDIKQILEDLYTLEPCGEANPIPRILFSNARIQSSRNLKGHLKVTFQYEKKLLIGFGPNLGHISELIKNSSVDLVGFLVKNIWNGNETVELKIDTVGQGS